MSKPIKNAEPCPFCGNTKITYVQGEDGWFIGCRYIGNHEACNALIGDNSSKAKLLAMWNKRVTLDPSLRGWGTALARR